MWQKVIITSGIIMSLLSCKGTEKIVSDQSKDRIYFGRTGGFTNIPMTYVLIGNNHLFKLEQEKYVPVRKLSKQQARDLETKIIAAGLDKIELNEPGNITYFIRVVRSGSEKEIKWSDSSGNKIVEDLYKTLLSTIKN